MWPPPASAHSSLGLEHADAAEARARGTIHLTLACVIEDRTELDRYRIAVPGAQITICRLTGPAPLRIERLANRMPPGPSLDWHIARATELELILESAAVEDFVVYNDYRPVRAVALEVLERAGWLKR